MPEEGTTISLYGQFITPPINVCVVDGILYSFSHDDFFDGRVVEAMELDGVVAGMELDKDTNTKGKNEKSQTENTDENTQIGKDCLPPSSLLVHSKEVWRGEDPGQHMFTTLCPSEGTFSLGCFPLLKVRV